MWSITDTKKLDQNTLKGSFSVEIGPLKIEGWTYHVKNGKSWVSPPSKEYIDKQSGEKKYYPMIKFPEKPRYYNFQKWAVSQVEEILAPATGREQVNDDDIPF
jgi:hypothetical protein